MAFNFNKVQPVEPKPVEKKLEPVDELKQFINTFLDDGKYDEAEAEQILQKAAELNISEDEAIDLMEAVLNQLKSQPVAASASSVDSIYPDDLLDVIKEGEIRNIKSVFRTWQNAISAIKTDNDQYDLIQCLYYMTFAALNPDGIIAEQESRKAKLISNYWRIYWTYIAYMKNDRKAYAEDMLVKLQNIAKYNEDNVTILETIAALNEAGPDAALKFFNSRNGAERYSSELLLLVKALRMEMGLVKATPSVLNECAFVLDNLIWWEDEDSRAERKAKIEAERKRKELEERKRIETEKRAIEEAEAAEKKRKAQADAEKTKQLAAQKSNSGANQDKNNEQQKLQKLWRSLLESRITTVTIVYGNGWYIGQKESGAYSGLGFLYKTDNTPSYIGNWKNGRKNGVGIRVCAPGKQFEEFENGCVYVGEWKDSKMHGIGAVYDKNGKQLFYGRFEADKPVEKYPPREEYSLGECRFEIIKYDNGNIYIGEVYKFDIALMTQKHKLGKGFFIWADNSSSAVAWYGDWNAKGRNGYGMLISNNGKSITTGTWKDDKKV